MMPKPLRKALDTPIETAECMNEIYTRINESNFTWTTKKMLLAVARRSLALERSLTKPVGVYYDELIEFCIPLFDEFDIDIETDDAEQAQHAVETLVYISKKFLSPTLH